MSGRKRPVHPTFSALRKRREIAGLTQGNLAKKIGVTAQTISFWETGYATPCWFSFECWAESLGVEIELVEVRHERTLDA